MMHTGYTASWWFQHPVHKMTGPIFRPHPPRKQKTDHDLSQITEITGMAVTEANNPMIIRAFIVLYIDMLINDLPYTHEREREMEREGGRECHLWSMRKSNHLSIKLLANIALRPRYEEISVSGSQEGCQNSPRLTMENCQMIDYRIVSPSRSRSLFFAILFSILCGVLPILAVHSLCVRDGLSDDLLVYCQRCSGNPLQKNKRKERGKGCRDRSSLVPKCGTNILLFHCILVPRWQTQQQQSHWQPFDVLFIDSSWVPLHPLHLRLIRIQFSPFSDFYEPINGTRRFLCDSLSSHRCLFFFLSLLLCLFYCMFVCLYSPLCCTFILLIIIMLFNPRPTPAPPRRAALDTCWLGSPNSNWFSTASFALSLYCLYFLGFAY